jgi:DNA-binding MarR family transcriptional regulator
MHSQTQNAQEIATLILSVLQLVAPAANRAANRGNISTQQTLFLSWLGSQREVMMTDVARWSGHSTAAATGLVDRLEKLKLVERVHAIDDRRKVLVQATPEGLKVAREFRELIEQEISGAMKEAGMGAVSTTVFRDLSAAFGKLKKRAA